MNNLILKKQNVTLLNIKIKIEQFFIKYILYIYKRVYYLYVLRKESEIMAIEFGMLQSIKAKGLQAQGPNANQQKTTVDKAQSIFDEYEKYKTQLSQANENGGETGSTTNVAFGSTSMSADDIQAKMEELENEFAKYYTAMNEKPQAQPQQGENEDDKNRIQPKQFGGLMA